jgi:hypothetical protein
VDSPAFKGQVSLKAGRLEIVAQDDRRKRDAALIGHGRREQEDRRKRDASRGYQGPEKVRLVVPEPTKQEQS